MFYGSEAMTPEEIRKLESYQGQKQSRGNQENREGHDQARYT
jgi:hypothetical protein